MIEKKVIVQLQQGLQARSAAKFVQKASSFTSEIHVIKDERSIVGKNVMGVVTRATKKGEELTLLVNGYCCSMVLTNYFYTRTTFMVLV
ncbi:HPr family phosphocarrier protein [Bacillus sp. OTU530]|uniref:HPr family phosphocarrier protein n=1 Tax=Bacillus sp. OTU530 TaxID=3043862 RepID=UPI00313D2370